MLQETILRYLKHGAARYLVTVAMYAGVGLGTTGLALWLASSLLAPAESAPSVIAQNTPPAKVDIPPPPGAAPAEEPAPAEADEITDGKVIEEELNAFIEPFIYDPEGRRDPFLPPSETAVVDGGPIGPLLPLQRFDLKDLLLIGIIWNVNEPKAMFLDPNKAVHVLGRDDRIGRNNGYIAVIREGEVVVVETIEIRGEQAFTTQILKIAR